MIAPRITATFHWTGAALVPMIQQAVAGIVQTAAQNIVAGAMERARVDTGTMRNSIHAEQQSDTEWWVVCPVHYAIYNEMGTVRMAAQPFMGPAVQAEASPFFAALRRAVA